MQSLKRVSIELETAAPNLNRGPTRITDSSQPRHSASTSESGHRTANTAGRGPVESADSPPDRDSADRRARGSASASNLKLPPTRHGPSRVPQRDQHSSRQAQSVRDACSHWARGEQQRTHQTSTDGSGTHDSEARKLRTLGRRLADRPTVPPDDSAEQSAHARGSPAKLSPQPRGHSGDAPATASQPGSQTRASTGQRPGRHFDSQASISSERVGVTQALARRRLQ